jgi:hypothetical protein
VETGERYAEGFVQEGEREAAREAAQLVVERAVAEREWEQASAASDARRCVEVAKDRIVRLGQPASVCYPEQCVLLRELFGPLPFRPVSVAPSLLDWDSGTVVRLARAAYEQRSLPDGKLDPTRLAVLADALEEAGCTDRDILGHLRGPGPHVRGCWAVDRLLGKS